MKSIRRIRQILLRLLAEEGYQVFDRSQRRGSCSELARAMTFDLALLDLNMPLKDGWETFEQLSARQPTLPIILITARPNQLFPALASGVVALLEKPLDANQTFSTIHKPFLRNRWKRAWPVPWGGPSVFSYVPPKSDGLDRESKPGNRQPKK